MHSHLPIYTNIHRIRRDIVAIVEDYLSLDQFRDMRINVNVIRPLVDKLYALDDISIGMASDGGGDSQGSPANRSYSVLSSGKWSTVSPRAGTSFQQTQCQLQQSDSL